MLRQRILTALVLAPLAVWAILALPVTGFALLFAVVMLMGGWEWSRLVGLTAVPARLGYVAAVAAGMALLWPLLPAGDSAVAVGLVALSWWLVAFVVVIRYPEGAGVWKAHPSARAAAGLFTLLPAWAGLVLLRQGPGAELVLLLVLLVWGADTGAYFAGRRFGRRKLAPLVSPGKTWEGVAGGLLLSFLIAILGWRMIAPGVEAGPFLVVALIVVLFSILGDLLESLFKRLMEVKDSGGLLPGHGGVLDRIDSLTAAAPLFAYGLYVIGGAR